MLPYVLQKMIRSKNVETATKAKLGGTKKSARQKVYADSWDRLLATKAIVRAATNPIHFPNLNDSRDVQVARCVAEWLGTDDGMDTLASAEAIARHFTSASQSYAAAWAAANRRTAPDSHRLLEHLMTSKIDVDMPLTLRDHEIAEQVFCWMGTGEGKTFVARCEMLAAAKDSAPFANARTARKAA